MNLPKVLLVILLFPTLSMGAANIPQAKRGELFLGVNSYEARSQFNDKGASNSFSENGRFNKAELSYYGLYSISDKVALLATGTILNELTFTNDDTSRKFFGSGDHSFGGRYLLRRDLSGAHSLQLLFSAPLYSKDANPGPGNHQEDVELRYLKDFYQVLRLDFMSLELAFRKRFAGPADQIRGDFSFGKTLNNFLIIGHLHYIQGLRNDEGNSPNLNPYVATDFDLLKIGPSVAYRYRKGEAIQIGYLRDIHGRNTGRGQTIFLTWWKDFVL